MKTWISVALLALVCFFQKGDCAISDWSNPPITTPSGTGTSSQYLVDGEAAGATGVTIAATTDGTITSYTVSSSTPAGITFTIDAAGVVTVSTAVSFATAPVYVLVIVANDGTTQTATTTLSVNDIPAFSATQMGLCIPVSSGSGTALATLAVTDTVNTGTLAYTITGGNTNTDWSITTAGVLTTANAMASTLRGYPLVITAAESLSSAQTGTVSVWIIVPDTCGGATAVFAGCITLLMALMVHL